MVAGPAQVGLLDACAESRAAFESRCAEDLALSGARAKPGVALPSRNGAPGLVLPNEMLPKCGTTVEVVIVRFREQMANQNAAAAGNGPIILETAVSNGRRRAYAEEYPPADPAVDHPAQDSVAVAGANRPSRVAAAVDLVAQS